MDFDVKEEKQNDPTTKVKPAAKIQIGDRSIPVLDFSLGGNSGHEVVAYMRRIQGSCNDCRFSLQMRRY